MNLKTNRLLIRKFKPEDWKNVYEYTSNPEVMHFIPEGVFSEQDAKDFLEKNTEDKAFPVVLVEENKVIGHIVFFRYFGTHTYEIGWVFNPDYYNNGYASEAAFAMLKYGFETMKLHRIIATCQPENTGSYKVMEKIGMRREGFFKKCIPNGEEWWDEYYYSILEEDWFDNLS